MKKYPGPFIISLAVAIGVFLGLCGGRLLIKVDAPEKNAVSKPISKTVEIITVGTIVPDSDGNYRSVREVPANHRSNTLEMFVRKNGNGSGWGYIFLSTAEEQARWQKIEARFFPVYSGNFADISYRKDFGAIRDPKQGLMIPTEDGVDFYKGTSPAFIPHWVVVQIPNLREG